jgi:hypothetical protein
LKRRVERQVGGYKRTLRKIADGIGAADAGADLQGRVGGVHRVLKKDVVSLKPLSIHVGGIVANHIQGS